MKKLISVLFKFIFTVLFIISFLPLLFFIYNVILEVLPAFEYNNWSYLEVSFNNISYLFFEYFWVFILCLFYQISYAGIAYLVKEAVPDGDGDIYGNMNSKSNQNSNGVIDNKKN